MANGKKKIGIFYDGYFFYKASSYYKVNCNARIDISGFHDFIRHETMDKLKVNSDSCQITEIHYFRGRMAADEKGKEGIYNERVFEDVLARAGVGLHNLPLVHGENNKFQEKGIDVFLTIEAMKAVWAKKINVFVLVAGDGDYVPLVREFKTMSVDTMLFGWDIDHQNGDKTRTSQDLINEVDYPTMVNSVIDDRTRRNDPLVLGILKSEVPVSFPAAAKGPGGAPSQGKPLAVSPVTVCQPVSDVPGLSKSFIVETAKSSPKNSNDWILGAEFGTILKAKGYNPKEQGTKVADIINGFSDLFEVNTAGPFSFRFKAAVPEAGPGVDWQEPASGGFSGTEFQPPMDTPRELTAEELSRRYTSSICTLKVEQGFGYIRSSTRYSNPKWNNHCFYLTDVQNSPQLGLEKDMLVEFQLAHDGFRSAREGVPLYRAVNIRMLETGMPIAI
jgi:uncharacterized LabA/DUF88 family protein